VYNFVIMHRYEMNRYEKIEERGRKSNGKTEEGANKKTKTEMKGRKRY
jgi:hypothetical protein